jgi:hypothetical protein
MKNNNCQQFIYINFQQLICFVSFSVSMYASFNHSREKRGNSRRTVVHSTSNDIVQEENLQNNFHKKQKKYVSKHHILKYWNDDRIERAITRSKERRNDRDMKSDLQTFEDIHYWNCVATDLYWFYEKLIKHYLEVNHNWSYYRITKISDPRNYSPSFILDEEGNEHRLMCDKCEIAKEYFGDRFEEFFQDELRKIEKYNNLYY